MFHQIFFIPNSNGKVIFFFCNFVIWLFYLATKFRTCHNSSAVVTCVKFCSDAFTTICIIVKWYSYQIWIFGSQIISEMVPADSYSPARCSWEIVGSGNRLDEKLLTLAHKSLSWQHLPNWNVNSPVYSFTDKLTDWYLRIKDNFFMVPSRTAGAPGRTYSFSKIINYYQYLSVHQYHLVSSTYGYSIIVIQLYIYIYEHFSKFTSGTFKKFIPWSSLIPIDWQIDWQVWYSSIYLEVWDIPKIILCNMNCLVFYATWTA